MNQLWIYWSLFILSSLSIIFSGTRLSITVDKIAAQTDLGGVFLGSILLAFSTSLPELVTISSAALIEAPDLAIGNIFGSYSINFLILVVMDLIHGRGPLLLYTGPGQLLLAFSGILLSSTSIFFMMFYTLSTPSSIGWLGWESPILLLSYLGSRRIIYDYQRKNMKEIERDVPLTPSREALSRLSLQFIGATLVILLSGVTIARSGEVLAESTRLGGSLIGTLLMGLSTSLPELITTITAVRIAAYDLAVGNILGSNILNITFIVIADLFYRPGPILSSVSLIHIGTAALGIMLTIITAIGLFYGSQKSVLLLLGWDTATILLIYIVGIYLLFF